jgi:hypothetical protein
MGSRNIDNLIAVSSTKLLTKLVIAAVFCAGSFLFAPRCAQAQDAQQTQWTYHKTSDEAQQKSNDESQQKTSSESKQSEPEKKTSDEPAPVTTETDVANQNPARTTESHSKSGNSTVDSQKVEVMGPDGRYVPFEDTETENVKVDATTTRTIVRTYRYDADGEKKLDRISEGESRRTASGDVQTVTTTSNSDVDGHLQIVARQVADTKKISPDAQETKTTLYTPDGNGGFAASQQTEQSQKTAPDHTVEVKTTTLLPDGNGGWQVGEQKESTTKQDGKNRTTEERTSLRDSEGDLSESSRTVEHETVTPTGETTHTVETYSKDVLGEASDGNLRLKQQVTTTHKKTADGEVTEQEVARPDPGNPSDGLQPAAKTRYTVLYGSSGAKQTTTTETRDGNGNFNVVSVETHKADDAPSPQKPAASSDKP